MILAENKAAPLRFLLVVTMGWVVMRGVVLSGWSPGMQSTVRWAPGPNWMAGALEPWRIAEPSRTLPIVGAARMIATQSERRLRGIAPRPQPLGPPGGPMRVGAPLDDVTMRYLALAGYDEPNRTFYARESYARATAEHEADAVTGAAATPEPGAAAAPRSRWSGSGWAFVRGGGYTTPLSPVGEIGAGQAGVRVLYRATGGLSLSGRISRTIGGPDQTEAAAGIDWQPVAGVPLHLTAERRIAIDDGGRNALALGASGGVYAVELAPGWRLDGYGEAGVVGARRRDLYADGAVRAGRAIDLGGGRSLTLGAGTWGAAQPHAARLDAGPTAVLRLPVERRTVAFALDYRARVVGDARPYSSVAFTAGVDF